MSELNPGPDAPAYVRVLTTSGYRFSSMEGVEYSADGEPTLVLGPLVAAADLPPNAAIFDLNPA